MSIIEIDSLRGCVAHFTRSGNTFATSGLHLGGIKPAIRELRNGTDASNRLKRLTIRSVVGHSRLSQPAHLPFDVRFPPKATEALLCSEMTRRAKTRHIFEPRRDA